MPVFPVGMSEEQYLFNRAANDGMDVIGDPSLTFQCVDQTFSGRIFRVVAEGEGRRIEWEVRYTTEQLDAMLRPFRKAAEEAQQELHAARLQDEYALSRKYHGGMIHVPNDVLTERLGTDILALADIQGQLQAQGCFDQVRQALCLQRWIAVEAMVYCIRDDAWDIRVRSKDAGLPWVPDGQPAPQLYPRYTCVLDEQGLHLPHDVQLVCYEERMELSKFDPDTSSSITFEDISTMLRYCQAMDLPFWQDAPVERSDGNEAAQGATLQGA